mgnify:CR=1 FL=1
MKGIILAGGSGSRLYPLTSTVSKQLLPIYDKPMIFYPLSVLMLAGIRDILLISSTDDINNYKNLLGDGSNFGISLKYKEQKKPDGIAQAFVLGNKFIGKSNVALILGDNIFFGPGFSKILKKAKDSVKGSTLFLYRVKDPERFGILEFDKKKNIISIEEKPKNPKSSFAITGLYFYDNKVVEYVKRIKPSKRGELEITDLNKIYLENHDISYELLGRGFSWLDTGTQDSLLDASSYIRTIEKMQGLKIACLEEIAFQNNWITKDFLLERANNFPNSNYGFYLKKIAGSKL